MRFLPLIILLLGVLESVISRATHRRPTMISPSENLRVDHFANTQMNSIWGDLTRFLGTRSSYQLRENDPQNAIRNRHWKKFMRRISHDPTSRMFPFPSAKGHDIATGKEDEDQTGSGDVGIELPEDCGRFRPTETCTITYRYRRLYEHFARMEEELLQQFEGECPREMMYFLTELNTTLSAHESQEMASELEVLGNQLHDLMTILNNTLTTILVLDSEYYEEDFTNSMLHFHRLHCQISIIDKLSRNITRSRMSSSSSNYVSHYVRRMKNTALITYLMFFFDKTAQRVSQITNCPFQNENQNSWEEFKQEIHDRYGHDGWLTCINTIVQNG